MVDCLQVYYKARLCKMFVINAGIVVYVLWKIAESFMDRNTRSKIFLSSEQNPAELLKYINPSQLPIKYGGSCEEPASFWPPTFPAGPIRDEFETKHATMDEFKAELLEKPQVMPSPELAAFVREHRSGNSKKGMFEPKTFTLQGRIERRDSFNGIVLERALRVSLPEPVVLLGRDSMNSVQGGEKKLKERASQGSAATSAISLQKSSSSTVCAAPKVEKEAAPVQVSEVQLASGEEVKESACPKKPQEERARPEEPKLDVEHIECAAVDADNGKEIGQYQDTPRRRVIGGDKACCAPACVIV